MEASLSAFRDIKSAATAVLFRSVNATNLNLNTNLNPYASTKLNVKTILLKTFI